MDDMIKIYGDWGEILKDGAPKAYAVVRGSYEPDLIAVFTSQKKAERYKERENLLGEEQLKDRNELCYITPVKLNPEPRPFPKYYMVYGIHDSPRDIELYEADEPEPFEFRAVYDDCDDDDDDDMLLGVEYSGTIKAIEGEPREITINRVMTIEDEEYEKYVKGDS